jgi:phosphatidylserine decarboxylase
MTSLIDALWQQEDVNFFLSNRIPRRLLTRLVRWISGIEQPVVRDVSIALFARFAGDLRLHEARKTAFTSLHDCFVRELKAGARPIADDARLFVSPCDGIVVATGTIDGTELVQAKGLTYSLDELLASGRTAEPFRGGRYVTLRLTSNMYHRFHAPCDGCVERVTHVSGDRWNVNPPALKRVPRLYCRNERAIVETRAATGEPLALVAVGAILVGSIRIHDVRDFAKGDELGYFEHGSTIVVVAPDRVDVVDEVRNGVTIRMGQPLLRRR